MVSLSASRLTSLPPSVETPDYDPSRISSGIVHFGVGSFHRSHEAMYIDRILNAGSLEWGICGVGILPSDRSMRDALRSQDNLYTLVTTSPEGTSAARVIASIVEYLYAPDDPDAVLAKLTEPQIKIVSLTITEGGYSVNDATGQFDPQDERTLADLASDSAPTSVLGYVVEALRLRRDKGTPPFTVMSCDNIPANGHVARSAVLGFAELKDPGLARWIADEVAFPSSMVDRITPVTTDETRAGVAADFGIEDLWPVRSESFEQWVLEDRFCTDRPPLEQVGVQLVADVGPYELMKLRLLNASHQVMSYLGILAGATYVHEVCTDPIFTEFLQDYMRAEAVPTLQPVPGIDLDSYSHQLIARFRSQAIRDTLARQVVDGSDRIPKFLLPVVKDQLAGERKVSRSALVLAAWSVFLEGRTEAGATIPTVDRRLPELRAAVAAERNSPGSFLDYSAVFGELGQSRTLRNEFIAARESLHAYGSRATIQALTAE